MFLQPSHNWQWQFDHERQCMTLSLDQDMLFASAVTARRVNLAGIQAGAFTLQQTEHYYHFVEALDSFNWPVPIKVQIALNAVAICDYHEPLMPQSWFFAYQGVMQECRKGDVMLLATGRGEHKFMILNVEPTSALCMALEPSTTLSDSKVLGQFEAIRVMRDRLIPLQRVQHYANVG